MKFKVILAMALGFALSASAQGYKDGIEYYKAGQYANAITLLNRNMNAADTDKALAQYYLGQANLANGDKAAAKTAFEAGLAANPDNAYNYVGIGALELLAGNTGAAKDNFKKAQSLAKKNAEVTIDIARAYYNAGPEKYAKEIEEAIKKAHKDSKDQAPSIYIFEGDRLAKARDWGGAAAQYEQAISFEPGNPEGYVKFANVYFNIKPDFAIQKLVELLQLQPNSAMAQRELAEKYYNNDQWTRAAVQYGKYIANPNHFPEDKARYTVLLFAGEKFDDAVRVAREVLTDYPDNFQSQRILVRSLDALKNRKEALAESEKLMTVPAFAKSLNAGDFTTHATLLAADSLEEKALQTLEQANARFPENETVLYGLADFYDGRNFAKAADYIAKMLKVKQNPERADYFDAARICLGAVYECKEDSVARAKYANEGIAYMDRSMQDLDLGGIPPSFIRRKGLMQLQLVNNIADEAVASTFQTLLDRLNMNPDYSNPASDRNLINYYIDAYRYITQYLLNSGQTEKAAETRAEMEKYAAMLQQ